MSAVSDRLPLGLAGRTECVAWSGLTMAKLSIVHIRREVIKSPSWAQMGQAINNCRFTTPQTLTQQYHPMVGTSFGSPAPIASVTSGGSTLTEETSNN